MVKRPKTDRKRCFFCKRKRAQHFIQWHSAAKIWECSDAMECANLVIEDAYDSDDEEPTLVYESPRHRCFRCKRKRAAHYLGRYMDRWQCLVDVAACYTLQEVSTW